MKPKRKILSLLLAICLVVGLLPTAAFAAGDTGKAIQLGASGISGWDSENGYDYIYYGTWNDSAIKWRVLDDQTNTGENGLFLLSEELLEPYLSFNSSSSPNPSQDWEGSDVQAWCKDFAGMDGSSVADAFSTDEYNAILETTKSDEKYSTESVSFAASDKILNGDKVFFLSAEEAENSEYGFTDNDARVANYNSNATGWWLRSPQADGRYNVGSVDTKGIVTTNYASNRNYGGRPAFNLDLNSVLFTSAANGGKPDDGLQAVPSQTRADRIVGQWDFNDTSDSSGNGNTLTTNGLVSFNDGKMKTQDGLTGNASVNLKLSGEAGFSLSLAFSTIRAGGLRAKEFGRSFSSSAVSLRKLTPLASWKSPLTVKALRVQSALCLTEAPTRLRCESRRTTPYTSSSTAPILALSPTPMWTTKELLSSAITPILATPPPSTT